MLPVCCEPLLQMESLFGSLPEMLDFQRVFLQTLEEKIASSPDCSTLETPAQFKVRHFPAGFRFHAGDSRGGGRWSEV